MKFGCKPLGLCNLTSDSIILSTTLTEKLLFSIIMICKDNHQIFEIQQHLDIPIFSLFIFHSHSTFFVVSTSTESFLKQLASWDKEEVPEKLQERVHFSKRIIARLLSAYEKQVLLISLCLNFHVSYLIS